MKDFQNVLQNAWSSSETIPAYVQQRFKAEIVPLLGQALPADPYVQERLQCILTDYRLKKSAEILIENAEAGENLVSLVGKVQTAKIAFQVGGVFVTGIIAAVALAVLSFSAGSAVGSLGSESWNNRKIAEVEAEAAYKAARLDFLRDVNADLMTCKSGKIEVQKNGKRACFYETGWYIE